jgi:hypothetical protein
LSVSTTISIAFATIFPSFWLRIAILREHQ